MCIINTIRLNSYISKNYKKTDKESRQLITNGYVKVGGVIRKEPGFRLNIAELVEVEEPFGISTFVSKYNINSVRTDKKMKDNNDMYKNIENEEKSALSLLPSKPLVFNIGRLDKDSTGLLIFTNDGRMSQIITNCNGNNVDIEKEYIVEVNTNIPDGALNKLRYGVSVLGSFCKPVSVIRESANSFKIVLKEGKNRQIRRMCRSVGYNVISLKRIRIGNYNLPRDLKEGDYRIMTKEDVGLLCYPSSLRE